MSESIPTISTPTLAASNTSAIGAAFASATASNYEIAQLAQFNNMSSKQFDAAAYSLNYTQTGCYRQGSLPVALASNDTCMPGWYCTYTTDGREGRSAWERRIRADKDATQAPIPTTSTLRNIVRLTKSARLYGVTREPATLKVSTNPVFAPTASTVHPAARSRYSVLKAPSVQAGRSRPSIAPLARCVGREAAGRL